MKNDKQYYEHDNLLDAKERNDLDYIIERNQTGKQAWIAFSSISIIITIYGFSLGFDYLITIRFATTWQLTPIQDSLIKGSMFFGFCISALLSGTFSDTYGRANVLRAAIFMGLLGSVTAIFMTDVRIFIISNIFLGFCFGLSIVSGLCLLVETSNTFDRGVFSLLMWSFFSIGSVLASYLCEQQRIWEQKNHNWRYLMVFRCCCLLLCGILAWFVEETAKFYFASGEPEKGCEQLEQMISFKDGKVPPRMREELIGRYSEQYKIVNKGFDALLSKEYLNLTLTGNFIQFVGFMALFTCIYSISYMAGETKDSKKEDEETIRATLERVQYLVNFESSFEFGIMVLFSFLPSVKSVGRLGAIRISFAVASIFSFLCVLVPDIFAVYFGISRCFLAVGGVTVYLYMAESHPTGLRANALALNTFLSRIGALSGPFLANMCMDSAKFLVPWLVSVSSLICFLVSFAFPFETFKRDVY